jgi:hypothetical protein
MKEKIKHHKACRNEDTEDRNTKLNSASQEEAYKLRVQRNLNQAQAQTLKKHVKLQFQSSAKCHCHGNLPVPDMKTYKVFYSRQVW